MTCHSSTSQGSGHDRLPTWNPKNGGMLNSQPVNSCLTNHSELCMSRLLNNQSRRISIYRPAAAIFRFRVFNCVEKWWPCDCKIRHSVGVHSGTSIVSRGSIRSLQLVVIRHSVILLFTSLPSAALDISFPVNPSPHFIITFLFSPYTLSWTL